LILINNAKRPHRGIEAPRQLGSEAHAPISIVVKIEMGHQDFVRHLSPEACAAVSARIHWAVPKRYSGMEGLASQRSISLMSISL
jgi:hypothetical protein